MNYIGGTFMQENGDTSSPDARVVGNNIYFEKSMLGYQGAKSLVTCAYDPSASGQTLTLTATDVRLNHDVTLAGPVGLHGVINGDGHNIFLDDDLTIPEGTILHITGSSVAIDGRGHKLFVDDWAQIFVDTDVTLTLRNMTVGNGRRSLTYPPIRLAAHGSKICFDSTIIALSNDFLFPQGQFFVHNDVTFTGTSAFIYTSPKSSWITSGGCLYFDHGTTFSLVPSSFTDAPYTLINTYTSNNFIKMADKTSTLFLNGCSLKTTDTGIRLSQGTIICDNATSFDTNATNSIARFSSTVYSSTSYGAFIMALSWSPDGKYIAVVGGKGSLVVYKAPDTSNGWLAETGYGGYLYAVGWSPDGKYIAVGGQTVNQIKIYQYADTNLELIATSTSYGGIISNIAWSPDGKYIAAGGRTKKTVDIHRFDQKKLTYLTSRSYGGDILSLSWSSDGSHIAAGGDVSNYPVRVYQFMNNQLLLRDSSQGYGGVIYNVTWSPDGRYVAAGGVNANNIKVYHYNGSTFMNGKNPVAVSQSYGGRISPYANVSWLCDGKYIAIGGQSTNRARIYQFTGTGFDGSLGSGFANNGYAIAQAPNYGGEIWTTRFSPDGKYVAVGGEGTQVVRVYPLEFTKPTIPQALSNSIVFGDSAKGADYDADVQILSGAQVSVHGKIFDDSVLN
jgi:WD40 repeat protein